MVEVLVLTGSNSPEREICLRSGAAVSAALQAAGHIVTSIDTAKHLASVDYGSYDAIFPVIHGLGGEDGSLQAQLESLGHHNFVGSDSTSSAICFDKWRYKDVLSQQNILSPAGLVVNATQLQDSALINQPFVLKPVDGGSSVDTYIVRQMADADFVAIEHSFAKYDAMLLEQLIEGTEITVGVLGNQALPVIEIIPPNDEEFDYENKYNGSTQELCPPQNISLSTQTKAQNLALALHKLTGCRDFSRSDMIVDKDENIYVLETNTIPGMTNQSLFPKMAATAHIDMVQLCDQLVQFAVDRR